jgi:2-oxoglutarate/2-oxoacid ferredoxin oxidoreductase subunit alpha
VDTDYQALIVSFGTMSRVCRTVIDNLKAQGFETAMIRPQTLFPFPEKPIKQAALKESCKVVFSIELNMGQMVEDVERSVQGNRPVHWYGKAGGDVPTPEEVIEVIKSFF